MKKLLNRKENLAVCLMELLVGIILLCRPVGFTSTIIMIVGILVCIKGLRDIIGYFRQKPVALSGDKPLARGLIELFVGLFCTFNAEWFIATFPVITLLYGVGLLVLGVSKIQWMADLLRAGEKKWYWAAIAAAMTIIPAVLIILNPFTSTAFLWTFVAISLIVDAVMDTVSLCMTPDAT